MPVTGLDKVVGNLKLSLENAKEEKTERAITAMIIEGGNLTLEITPKDDGSLVQSLGRKTWATDLGYAGAVYFGMFYAPYVHEMPGTLRGQPRAHFGKTGAGQEFGGGSLRGFYWDTAYGTADAKPQFLKLGMEEMAASADAILKSVYSVN